MAGFSFQIVWHSETRERRESKLPRIKQIRPDYAESFHCIGSACEDTCCRGWSVPIEREAHERFQQLPNGSLRTLIDASILFAPKGATSSDGYGSGVFAKIAMDPNNCCPMLTADRLCRIHAECGKSLLPHTCSTYPRLEHSVGGRIEQALAFSCPEAVRHVLLNPMRLEIARPPAFDSADGSYPLPFFWEIREAVLNLVQNRAYPLWQRIFLMGILCRRLDAIASGELDRTVPTLLMDFNGSVRSGRLRKAMEAQPVDRKAQLDVVLRLAGLLLHKSNVLPRFVECIDSFAAGIGNGPTATLETLTDQYSRAHDRYFDPYFARQPQVLENYLINTIVRTRFPFGNEGMKPGSAPSAMREFAMLTAQFALTKGLLIGVSGFHKENFSAEHVVHTVQAASKHFDHYPDFPKLAYELLAESRLDGARGFSILLRNADSPAAEKTHPTVYVPGPKVSI